jgi:release factor glutamine methyltransferase
MAQGNVERLGLAGRATIARGSWDAASRGDFDLILCNPPYIETDAVLPPDVADYEPAVALYAGRDGLDDYRRIAPLLRLPTGGIACVEIGATQAEAVHTLFEAAGFRTRVNTDLAGRDRCIVVAPQA